MNQIINTVPSCHAMPHCASSSPLDLRWPRAFSLTTSLLVSRLVPRPLAKNAKHDNISIEEKIAGQRDSAAAKPRPRHEPSSIPKPSPSRRRIHPNPMRIPQPRQDPSLPPPILSRNLQAPAPTPQKLKHDAMRQLLAILARQRWGPEGAEVVFLGLDSRGGAGSCLAERGGGGGGRVEDEVACWVDFYPAAFPEL